MLQRHGESPRYLRATQCRSQHQLSWCVFLITQISFIYVFVPGVIDIHAFRPRKRQCRGHWAENSVENVVASTVLQTSMTITHQINLLSTQYEWGRRAADFLPTRAHREPYVWATWNVRLCSTPRIISTCLTGFIAGRKNA